MFLRKFPSGPVETNAVLFGCEKTRKAAVIDPSLGSCEPILLEAAELGLTIEKVLLTHSHWDHIADLATLLQKISAKVYVHPLDAENVEKPGSDGLQLFFPITGVKPDHLIVDGERISVGELSCEVIHTPGHCPGAVCYFLKEQKVLFSGDTLFEGSFGRLDLSTGQPDKMWESLRKLSKLPPDTRVVPGHGPDTFLKAEKWMSRAKEIFSNEVE